MESLRVFCVVWTVVWLVCAIRLETVGTVMVQRIRQFGSTNLLKPDQHQSQTVVNHEFSPEMDADGEYEDGNAYIDDPGELSLVIIVKKPARLKISGLVSNGERSNQFKIHGRRNGFKNSQHLRNYRDQPFAWHRPALSLAGANTWGSPPEYFSSWESPRSGWNSLKSRGPPYYLHNPAGPTVSMLSMTTAMPTTSGPAGTYAPLPIATTSRTMGMATSRPPTSTFRCASSLPEGRSTRPPWLRPPTTPVTSSPDQDVNVQTQQGKNVSNPESGDGLGEQIPENASGQDQMNPAQETEPNDQGAHFSGDPAGPPAQVERHESNERVHITVEESGSQTNGSSPHDPIEGEHVGGLTNPQPTEIGPADMGQANVQAPDTQHDQVGIHTTEPFLDYSQQDP